jgi:hypothetical protein
MASLTLPVMPRVAALKVKVRVPVHNTLKLIKHRVTEHCLLLPIRGYRTEVTMIVTPTPGWKAKNQGGGK